MKLKISPIKHWEENISLIMIVLGFIDLLSEEIHEMIKWPMMGIGLASFVACFVVHKRNSRAIIVLLSVTVLTILELILSEGILLTQYLWDIGICFPIALCIFYAQNVSLKKWINLYIIITLFLVYRQLTVPDHYSVLYSHSRNYISVFQIFLLFIIAIIAKKNEQVVPKWLYYSLALVCVIAVGRGGVLSGLLILVLYILYDVYKERKGSNKTFKILVLMALVVALFIAFSIFNDYIIQRFFPRFGKTGIYTNSSELATTKRLMMWSTYIGECLHSIKFFLFGTDPSPIVLLIHQKIDFNLHNSFLMNHVFYGIIGTITLIVIIVKFIRKLAKNNCGEIIIIFIGYLFRGLFDFCFPGKLSAVVVWIALLYAFIDTPKRKIRSKPV